MKTKRIAFLDRDGTIVVEKNYLASPDEVEVLPNAAKGLHRLQELGFQIVILTNQSGIARGYFTRETVDSIHRRITDLVASEGASIDGFYVCPHLPESGCACRKPEAGLAIRAAKELGFSLDDELVVIGDKQCDVELGQRIGARTVLVRTGYGAQHLDSGQAKPDLVASDLQEAADMIANDHAEATLWSGAAERLRRHIIESIRTKQEMLAKCDTDILLAATIIVKCLDNGNKVMICGNGGSAADAQHIAAEFVSVLTQDYPRPGLAAIALTTDTSVLTASANDYGFDGIFERQVQALGMPGDVLVGISTSGDSENVLRAMKFAAQRGMQTIGLTGATGGKLAAYGDVCIRIPSVVTAHIQEAHITVGHILCAIIERSVASARVAADEVRSTSGGFGHESRT